MSLSEARAPMEPWNPWLALRDRPHITLRFAPLVDEYGYIEDHGDGTRTIVLADDLDFEHLTEVLAHELVHEELDLLWPPWAPPHEIAAGERQVDEVTAARLLRDPSLDR